MKLIERGTKLDMVIECDHCGSTFACNPTDPEVKQYDSDYTSPSRFDYYVMCTVCKYRIDFNRKRPDNGAK